MTFNKKYIKRVIIVLSIPFILIFLFWMIYPHQYPFVDMKVLGSTREEIIAMYGEPRYEGARLGERFIAYSVSKKPYSLKTKQILWYNGGTAEGVWYYIFLKDDGVAYDVEIQLQIVG